MNDFLNEKVNIIVASKSGGGTAMTGEIRNQTVTNNTITIRGILKTIENNFIILEDVQLIQLPQYSNARKIASSSNTKIEELSYRYKKTAINIDNIITISIV